MIDLNYVITILIGCCTAVLFLCSLALSRGGWYRTGEEHPQTTPVQRLGGWAILATAISFIFQIVYNSISPAPSALWQRMIDGYCVALVGFLPIEALLLQQKPVRWYHMLYCFGPATLLIIFAPFFDSMSGLYTCLTLGVYLLLMGGYILAILSLRKWDKKMLNAYSDVTYKLTDWYWKLTLPMFIITAIWLPLYYYPKLEWLQIVYHSAVIVLYLRFTSYVLHQEVPCAPDDEVEEEVVPAEQAEAEKLNETPAWAERLELLIKEEHVYRNPDLDSAMLAEMAGVNRTYLSRYLNQVLGVSFYDYVKTYRLEESCHLLATTQWPIEEVATKCGFRDRSVFGRLFRVTYNTTPSEYRKAHQQS